MAQTILHTLRLTRRNPAVTAVALASIAIGTSASAVVFAAVKTVLIQPFPYARPSELVQIRTDDLRSDSRQDWVNWSDMQEIARRSNSFASLGVSNYAILNLAGDANSLPEALYGLSISSSLFPTLGVKPMLGRNVLPEEDQPKHAQVILLSHGLWVRKFGSDRGVIGRTVQANGHAATIIGVMPPGFAFPMRLATTVRPPSPYSEFWAAPLPVDKAKAQKREDYGYNGLARLKPGVTAAQASQEVAAISVELDREHPRARGFLALRAMPFVERSLGSSRTGLWLLFGASGLFMLIGCANVANLLLASGLSRQREFAIRVAVGANRSKIIRQLMIESSVLAVAGGIAGFILTALAWRLLPAIAPMSIPRLAAARADFPVFAFSVAISLLNGVLFGVLPAFRAAELDSNLRVRESTSGGGLRGILVGAESAVAVILVVGGSLLAANLIHLLTTDPGFDASHVLASIIVPAGDQYPTPDSRARLWPKILERVRQLPGVDSAGTVDALPFSGENGGAPLAADASDHGPMAEIDAVSAEYLQTMGAKLLDGRWFREDDVLNHRHMIILDEIAARKIFPGGDAVGKRVCIACFPNQGPYWEDVIGVVSSMHHAAIDDPLAPAAYLSDHSYEAADFLVVRTQRPSAQLAQAIRRAVASADPNQPVLLSATMSTLIGDSIADRRFLYMTLSITGALALLLAAAGVYGVVSHATSRRTREIGIRMAIGATPLDVLRLVLGQGMRPVMFGVAAGIAGAIAVFRLLRSAFNGIDIVDSRVFFFAVVLVLAAASAACWMPAQRASKLDPVSGLKQE